LNSSPPSLDACWPEERLQEKGIEQPGNIGIVGSLGMVGPIGQDAEAWSPSAEDVAQMPVPKSVLAGTWGEGSLSPCLQSFSSKRQPASSSTAQAGDVPASGSQYQRVELPSATLNLEMSLRQERDLDLGALRQAIHSIFGWKARLDFYRHEDLPSELTSARAPGRWQAIRCQVSVLGKVHAHLHEFRERTSRLNSAIQTHMGLTFHDVRLDAVRELEEVDSLVMKLASGSGHVLCGACLVYNRQGRCEKVVRYDDRHYLDDAVRHSGDHKESKQSRHHINIALSKLPHDVEQLFFTVCACGHDDLSCFRNPTVELYEKKRQAKLYGHALDKVALQCWHSHSLVVARLIRMPVWEADARAQVIMTLRRCGLQWPCVQLVLSMAYEGGWYVQALGTEEWSMREKACTRQYDVCQGLIERHLRAERGLGNQLGHACVGAGAGCGDHDTSSTSM